MPTSKKIFSVLLISLALLVPVVISAQGFTDPLKDVCKAGATTCVKDVLVRVLNFMLSLVGILSIMALVYGGIMYIISLGNDSRVKTAKSTITWAIIGLAVSILSILIIQFVGNILQLK